LQTRSALFALFAILVAVPVAAAVYLGAAGLQRERTMLIEQEQLAMAHRADDVRDRLVLQLQRDRKAGATDIAERYLDPVSPHSVVPRFDDRLEYARLVEERHVPGVVPTGEFGLPSIYYRYVVPTGRQATPLPIGSGFVLEMGLHPASALGKQIRAGEERLLWTLGTVALVVLLGSLFAWRAVRAETRLAARKAEFVSAVSHELRTPLTSIRMYADMLKEGWVKDETTREDYFALISAESERLARLVNNVLDFSSIEKGRKDFEMQLGDPGDVVRDVAQVLRPYLRQKGFELHVEVPDALPECSFDKDALTQILVNLIDNAVKYGEREVRLEAEATGGEVCLRVLDRGKGIPAGERDKIFEAFHRGSNAHSAGGSGLGLALVHHYASAHNASIEVGAREGGGAVFSLRLPAA